MKVSYFKNYYQTVPTSTLLLENWLFSDDFKEVIEQIRCSVEQTEVDRLKQTLPCILPSGVFSSRSVDDLLEFSGFMCVDIDKLGLTDESLCELKFDIGEAFPSVYYSGLSVSGKGLFLMVRIASDKSYSASYLAFSHALTERFEIEADKSCKHISRLRLISYDPYPYYNPEPSIYEEQRLPQFSSKTPNRTFEEQVYTRKKVEALIDLIRKGYIDITDQYADWYAIGKALAAEYGKEPDGEYFFHLISRISSKYDEGECDKQYTKCFKHRGNTTIATFFFKCREHGIVLPRNIEEWGSFR